MHSGGQRFDPVKLHLSREETIVSSLVCFSPLQINLLMPVAWKAHPPMKRTLFSLLIFGTFVIQGANATPRKSPRRYWVKTYTRKNGTVVQGHWAGRGATPSGLKTSSKREDFNSFGSVAVPSSTGVFAVKSSPHLYDTYPQEATQEPSWVREQRREKSEKSERQTYLRSLIHSDTTAPAKRTHKTHK